MPKTAAFITTDFPSTLSNSSAESTPTPEFDQYTQTISAGRYTARFAQTAEELTQAQALRYQVLFRESGGMPSAEMQAQQREQDQWDAQGLHVIVLEKLTDKNGQSHEQVVGTVRLVPKNALQPAQPLYTETSFDLSQVFAQYDKPLEISRFCIHPDGRQGGILMLIWKFALQYIYTRGYDLLVGCASFKGTDITQHQEILSYLYDHHLAPHDAQPKAICDNAVPLQRIHKSPSEWQHAKQAIPTLMRGYLKVGAKISDCAIIDPVFNTVFVCIYANTKQLVSSQQPLVKMRQTAKAEPKHAARAVA